MIHGISHITFVVSDLERTSRLLEHVLGGVEVYDSGDEQFSLSREKFFLVNDVWIAIMEGQSLRDKTYNHVAFQIEDEDFDSYVEKVESLGLEVREARSRIAGEGQSLYFYDFDNHLFELHTGTLKQRLECYSRARANHRQPVAGS